MGEDSDQTTQLRSGKIEFIFVLVRDNLTADVADRVAEVIEIASKLQCHVENIVSSLVVITLGTIPFDPHGDRKTRARVVADLVKKLKSHIKILHGCVRASYGSYGIPRRMTYGTIFPNFSNVLGKLASMEFGEITEWNQTAGTAV